MFNIVMQLSNAFVDPEDFTYKRSYLLKMRAGLENHEVFAKALEDPELQEAIRTQVKKMIAAKIYEMGQS